MNVVAVGAHPDDVELYCAGTLLRYRAAGHAVWHVCATDGRAGRPDDPAIDPDEVVRTRDAEARRAAEICGATYVNLGFVDQELEPDLPARSALADVLREVRAEVVLTHPPRDYHADHRAVSQLVFDAAMHASAVVPSALPRLERCPAVWWMEPTGALDWQPTHYVDVTDVIDAKLAMIRAHASQVENMRAWGALDLEEYALTLARLRGIQSGVRYAEGFRPALAWPRLRAGHTLPG